MSLVNQKKKVIGESSMGGKLKNDFNMHEKLWEKGRKKWMESVSSSYNKLGMRVVPLFRRFALIFFSDFF